MCLCVIAKTQKRGDLGSSRVFGAKKIIKFYAVWEHSKAEETQDKCVNLTTCFLAIKLRYIDKEWTLFFSSSNLIKVITVQ